MWASLISNLRDAFSKSKEAPLKLESRPVDNDLIIEEEGVFCLPVEQHSGCVLPGEAATAGAGVEADRSG